MIALIYFILFYIILLICIILMSAFAVDLVMRFCGGPLDSNGPCLPSTVRLLVARRLLLVVACPIFVFVARCNVGFVLAAFDIDTSDYDKIHK